MIANGTFRYRTLFKDTIIYGTGRYTSQIIGIFILPIYTKLFSPHDYGIIEILNTFLFISGYLVIAGTDTALRAYYYKEGDENKRKELAFTTIMLQTLSSLAFALLFLKLSPSILKLFSLNSETSPIFKIAVLNLIPLAIFVSCQEILKLKFKPISYSVVSIGEVILVYSLSLYLIIGQKMGIKGYFLGKLVADSFFAVVALITAIKHIKPRFSLSICKALVTFGFFILIAQILAMISSTDRFMLARYADLSRIGIYAIAIKLCSLVALFTTAFLTAWGPTSMSIQSQGNAKDIYYRVLRYYSAFILSIAFYLGLFSREILHLLVQPSFWEAYKYVGFLGYSMGVESLVHIVNVGLLIKDKPSKSALAVGVSSIFNLIMFMLLIPKLGIAGAVISLLATKFLLVTVSAYVAGKYYRIEWHVSKIARIFLINLAFYPIFLFFEISRDGLNIFLKLIIATAYIITILASGVFVRSDLERFRNRMPSKAKLFDYISTKT